MRLLKREKVELWGQPHTIRPALVDKVFGDGREFVWFQSMDDRPNYYVARVPTGFSRSNGYPDLIDDIEDAIRDESFDFYSERAWKEYDRFGYVDRYRRWPIPAVSLCGSEWGPFSPPDYLLAMCGMTLARTKINRQP